MIWDMSGRKKEPRAARIKAKGSKAGERRPAKRARRSAT